MATVRRTSLSMVVIFFTSMLALLSLPAVPTTHAAPINEVEPNDTTGEAQHLSSIGLDNPVHAAIDTPGELDYFSFDVVAGQAYVVELFDVDNTLAHDGGSRCTGYSSRPRWGVYPQVYRPDGTIREAIECDNNAGGNVQTVLQFSAINNGTFYVGITAHANTVTGDYKMRILHHRSHPDAAWDDTTLEPNNSSANAYEILTGRENALTAAIERHPDEYYSDYADVDWYHFDAEAGESYTIELFHVASTLAATSGSKCTGYSSRQRNGLWLELRDPNFTEITRDCEPDYGAGVQNSYVFEAPASGTYSLKITAHANSVYGNYSVRIVPGRDLTNASWDETTYEPNNWMSNAYPIQIGREYALTSQIEQKRSQFYTPRSDADNYYFPAEMDRTYRVVVYDTDTSLSAASGSNCTGKSYEQYSGLWLWVGDPLDNQAAERCNPNGDGSFHTAVEFEATRTGNHTIWIAPNEHSLSGSYSVYVEELFCEGVTEITTPECEGLVALYETLDGDNWTNNNGWLDTNTPCSWDGVDCTGNRVTSLDLSTNNLSGTLPSEIGNLSSLSSLLLSDNPDLGGPMPGAMTNITNLETYRFANTDLCEPLNQGFQDWMNGIAQADDAPCEATCEALDLMLVLDGSGSINSSEFDQMQSFASDVVNSFVIGPDDARIGVVQFSGTNRGRLEIGLSDDASAVNSAISNMSQLDGSTDIHEAISLARTEFASNGRVDTPKVMILLTDGAHKENSDPVAEAHLAEEEGIILLTVSVGDNTRPDMLRRIASDPDQHAFAVSDFADLTLLLDTLVRETCENDPPKPPEDPPEPSLSISGVEPDEGYNDTATSVQITGEAFSTSPTPQVQLSRSGTTVDLSGVTAASSRSLEASIPAGLTPGTYDMTVTNPGGESTTRANAFTVLARNPELISVIPVVGYNDVDNEIHVYGTGFADGAVLALGSTDLDTTRINGTSLRAIVPAGLPIGTYDLTVTNPDSGQDQLDDAYTLIDSTSNNDLFGYDHELWFNPEVPRAGETMQMGLFVHRQGGKAALQDVPVRFVRDAVDGTVLGDSTVPFLDPPTDVDSTRPLDVTFSTPGTYTIYAIIDPDNEIDESDQGELNNVVSRTLTVAAPTADVTVPVVQEIVINGGVNEPAQAQSISVDISALDPPPGSSGVHAVHIIEYVFNQGARQWVPVAQSGWMPYENLPSTYRWQLEPSPGVHYIQVRAIDQANNISIGHARQVVNYQPSADDIQRNATHVYRYSVEDGQQLTASLDVLSGDADLYVWPPRADQSARVSNVANGDEQVFIPATEISEGVYQIEVFGYTTASYRLQVVIEDAQTTAGLEQQAATISGIDPTKPVPSAPLMPIDSVPSERQGIVPPPETEADSADMQVYLPFIHR